MPHCLRKYVEEHEEPTKAAERRHDKIRRICRKHFRLLVRLRKVQSLPEMLAALNTCEGTDITFAEFRDWRRAEQNRAGNVWAVAHGLSVATFVATFVLVYAAYKGDGSWGLPTSTLVLSWAVFKLARWGRRQYLESLSLLTYGYIEGPAK